MYTINKALLVVLLIGLICVGGMVHWVHGLQNRRHADFFLQRAHAAKAEQKPDEAAEEFLRYLRLAANDGNARAELGLLQADRGRFAEAFPTLEEALRLAPDRQDVRRKLVEVAIRLRRPSDAEAHLEILLEKRPDDPELHEILAAALAARGKYVDAAAALETAIEKGPDRLSAYRALAELLRTKLDLAGEADEWMSRAVKENPSSPEAWCLRGEYRRQTGRLEEAADDAAEAMKLDADSPAALMLAAECALQLGDYDEACDYSRRGLDLDPGNQRMRIVLADTEASGGNLDAAVATLRNGLGTGRGGPKTPQNEPDARGFEPGPGDAVLLHSMAMVLMGGGKTAEAAKVIDELEKLRYPTPLVAFLEAMLAWHEGRWVTARDGFEQVRRKIGPFREMARQAEYHLADCYGRLGQRQEQIAACRRTIAIDRNYTPARLKLAELLLAKGEVDEALAAPRNDARGGLGDGARSGRGGENGDWRVGRSVAGR